MERAVVDGKVERQAPIYVSYLTFTTLLDWLRDAKIIPSQFDRSYWGGKFSGSTGAQLMSGLRFLGLLNSDKPDDRLELIAFAKDEDRPALIKALLADVYGSDLVDGLARATPATLNAALRALGTTDATHDKARSFFVNAAKAVGLPMPAQIAKQARNRPQVSRKATKKKGANTPNAGPNGGDTSNADPLTPPTPKTPEFPGLASALMPLVLDLIRDGGNWDKPARDRWLATFTMLLDYSYPAKEASPAQ
jgi:hypothetical protein